jgi:hypothetical protein
MRDYPKIESTLSTTQVLEALTNEIKSLREDVRQMSILLMRDKIDTTWIPETDAAAMLQMQPDTLRRYVKAGKPNFQMINFRHTNGRKWQYNRKDILKFKNYTSTQA